MINRIYKLFIVLSLVASSLLSGVQKVSAIDLSNFSGNSGSSSNSGNGNYTFGNGSSSGSGSTSTGSGSGGILGGLGGVLGGLGGGQGTGINPGSGGGLGGIGTIFGSGGSSIGGLGGILNGGGFNGILSGLLGGLGNQFISGSALSSFASQYAFSPMSPNLFNALGINNNEESKSPLDVDGSKSIPSPFVKGKYLPGLEVDNSSEQSTRIAFGAKTFVPKSAINSIMNSDIIGLSTGYVSKFQDPRTQMEITARNVDNSIATSASNSVSQDIGISSANNLALLLNHELNHKDALRSALTEKALASSLNKTKSASLATSFALGESNLPTAGTNQSRTSVSLTGTDINSFSSSNSNTGGLPSLGSGLNTTGGAFNSLLPTTVNTTGGGEISTIKLVDLLYPVTTNNDNAEDRALFRDYFGDLTCTSQQTANADAEFACTPEDPKKGLRQLLTEKSKEVYENLMTHMYNRCSWTKPSFQNGISGPRTAIGTSVNREEYWNDLDDGQKEINKKLSVEGEPPFQGLIDGVMWFNLFLNAVPLETLPCKAMLQISSPESFNSFETLNAVMNKNSNTGTVTNASIISTAPQALTKSPPMFLRRYYFFAVSVGLRKIMAFQENIVTRLELATMGKNYGDLYSKARMLIEVQLRKLGNIDRQEDLNKEITEQVESTSGTTPINTTTTTNVNNNNGSTYRGKGPTMDE